MSNISGNNIMSDKKRDEEKRRDKSKREMLDNRKVKNKKQLFGVPIQTPDRPEDVYVKQTLNNSFGLHETFLKVGDEVIRNSDNIYGVNPQPQTPITSQTVRFPLRNDNTVPESDKTKFKDEVKKRNIPPLNIPNGGIEIADNENKKSKVNDIMKQMTLVTPLSSIEPAEKFPFPTPKIQMNGKNGHSSNLQVQHIKTEKLDESRERQPYLPQKTIATHNFEEKNASDSSDSTKTKSKKSTANRNENKLAKSMNSKLTESISSSDSSSDSDSSSASSSDDEKDDEKKEDQPTIENREEDDWSLGKYLNLPKLNESKVTETSTVATKNEAEKLKNLHAAALKNPIRKVNIAKNTGQKVLSSSESSNDDSGDEDFQPGLTRKKTEKSKSPRKTATTNVSKVPQKVLSPSEKSSSLASLSDDEISIGNDSKSISQQLQYKQKPMAVILPLNSTTCANAIGEMPAQTYIPQSTIVNLNSTTNNLVVSIPLELLRSLGIEIPSKEESKRNLKRKTPESTSKDKNLTKRIKQEVVETITSNISDPDHLMHCAKECKKAADSVQGDIWHKSTLYMKAVLYFLEWAQARERTSDPKTIFKNYRETLPLVKKIYSWDGQTISSNRERKLYVLNLRIQSILCFKLFTFRSDEAKRLKRYIDDQSLQQVNEIATPNLSSQSPQANNKTIAVPLKLHQARQKYLCDVSYLFEAHEFWRQADNYANSYVEFFNNLDIKCKQPLSIHSTIEQLVRYMRIGLDNLSHSS